jgi:hypothetical protein
MQFAKLKKKSKSKNIQFCSYIEKCKKSCKKPILDIYIGVLDLRFFSINLKFEPQM